MAGQLELVVIVALALLTILSQSYFTTDDNQDAGSQNSEVRRSGWLKDEDGAEETSHTSHRTHEDDDTHADADAGTHGSTSLARREEQIALYETELETLRDGKLREAMNNAYRTQEIIKKAKANSGWLYYTGEERDRIQRLDAEMDRNLKALAAVQAEEKAIQLRIKPLHGIVSFPFYVEQRSTIKSCVSKVQEIAYNNAWYSGLFNAHRAENISDLLIQFLIEWVGGYIIMYPFAVLYYALWAAPWSIYEYSSGSIMDVLPAVAAWLVGVLVMMLPLLALGGGLWWVFANYGDRMAAEMQRRREQQERHQGRPNALGGRAW